MAKSLPLNSRSKTTALKQPRELFSYARDIDGKYVYDDPENSLSYYYLPDSTIDTGIDLQGGYSKFKKIPDEQNLADFNSLLKAIIKHETSEGKKISSDIITFRGIMTKILSLPYNLTDPIDLYVVPFDGQLFIKSDDELDMKRRKEQEVRMKQTNTEERYDYMKRCEYVGYKFETIATIPKPWSQVSRSQIENRNKKVVNNYEQYLSVIRTGIGNVKLVLAGEIDCCWDYLPDEQNKKLNHYVELKTSRIIENNSQVVSFEQKLFKAWCQCFLMGVTKIIYGFRDNNLILKNVELFNTEEIPILIKNNPLTNAATEKKINCTNALKWYGAVVDWLNTTVDKKDEIKSYRLKYDPVRKSFTLSETDSETNEKLRNGQLLTPEFTEWRQSLKK
ncbi:protein RAI1 [Candida albicans P57072]|nr:protein RAI1 [Candida albicans P57072]KHC57626.1 protein RAI1 [Candida albicans P60002]